MTGYRKLGAVLAAATLGVASLLAGCSALGQVAGNHVAHADPQVVVKGLAEQAKEIGAAETYELLADGEITEAEIVEAQRLLQACVGAHGVELSDPVVSPVDGLTREWDLRTDLGSFSEASAEELIVCQEAWALTSAAYTATHEHSMDPALSEYVLACMTDQGYEIGRDASKVADFVGTPDSDGGAQRSDTELCIWSGVDKLFPELPGVTISH